MNIFRLDGKRAIVTGGAGGLGQALCVALASAGAKVIVPGRKADGGDTQQLVEAAGGTFQYIQSDITEPGACKAVVDACRDAWGGVDVLVNCAGVSVNIPNVTEFTREPWDQTLGVNLTAAFEMIHHVTPHMMGQKSGKIINIASVYSFLGGRWSPAYASSKHGLVGLTKAMCDELAGSNIQVNAIAPGFFETPLTAMTRSDEKRNAEILERIPANRWGQFTDLMGAMIFLASNASDYVNGTVLTVDGGFLVR